LYKEGEKMATLGQTQLGEAYCITIDHDPEEENTDAPKNSILQNTHLFRKLTDGNNKDVDQIMTRNEMIKWSWAKLG